MSVVSVSRRVPKELKRANNLAIIMLIIIVFVLALNMIFLKVLKVERYFFGSLPEVDLLGLINYSVSII